MVLQHTYIVMSDRNLIINTDQKDIVDARMLKIVQRRTNITAHLLQIVKPDSVFNTSIYREVVECLADIGSVRLVMIRDSLIPSG